MKVILTRFVFHGHKLEFYQQTQASHYLLLFVISGALDEVNEAVKGVEESIRKLVR